MNKNYKGFTLIELLAVIVILAIIALISVPLILNVVDTAEKGAFKDSGYGLVKAAETKYATNLLKGNEGDATYTFVDGIDTSTTKLDFKGSIPKDGIIVVEKGKISIAIWDGKYCVSKGFDDTDNTIEEIGKDTCLDKVSAEAPIVNADTSGANEPDLVTGLIPVKYDGTNWIKADSTNASGANQWYDYGSKMWANAVTVTSTNRATYQSAAVGTVIADADINTFWVWIPRYSYYITTSGTTTPSEIQIQFEGKTDSKSTGDAVSIYLTHPAFTFGSTEVSGIWVGKFETTGTIGSPTVLPNAISLRSQTVSAMYNASRAMQNNNTYGTSTDTNIHMTKDSEWGAVAYLSHSKYGINTEIWINNDSTYHTGCAGNSVSEASNAGCLNAYNTTNGNKASTTGNIYGVYDMSGGAYEYTMSNYNNILASSGFASMPTPEYYDLYTSTTVTTACSGAICYGRALSETSGWYTDFADFVSASYPFSVRGGYGNATNAGAFSFGNFNGSSNTNYSFRLSLMKP